jgi:hypothetical protein
MVPLPSTVTKNRPYEKKKEKNEKATSQTEWKKYLQ